jgi:hypothetical protein
MHIYDFLRASSFSLTFTFCIFKVYPAILWKQCRSPTFFSLTPKLGKPSVSLSNSSSMTRLCFNQGSPYRRPESGNKLGRSRSILNYSRFRLFAPILNPTQEGVLNHAKIKDFPAKARYSPKKGSTKLPTFRSTTRSSKHGIRTQGPAVPSLQALASQMPY